MANFVDGELFRFGELSGLILDFLRMLRGAPCKILADSPNRDWCLDMADLVGFFGDSARQMFAFPHYQEDV